MLHQPVHELPVLLIDTGAFSDPAARLLDKGFIDLVLPQELLRLVAVEVEVVQAQMSARQEVHGLGTVHEAKVARLSLERRPHRCGGPLARVLVNLYVIFTEASVVTPIALPTLWPDLD